MKKISLSIPQPCHEAWDAMTPDAKGRFCGSCQKSVVDFSVMSDRQIAEFFKKPVGSVCGRFHQEQLNREIDIPKKRIPWVRYFFTISLPAFLASCKFFGEKETVGKIAVQEQRLTGDTVSVDVPPVLGMALSQINAVDSAPAKKPVCKPQKLKGFIVGELAPPPPMIDEDKGMITPAFDSLPTKETLPMDTVNITHQNISSLLQTVAGGISVQRVNGKKQKPLPLTEAPKDLSTLVAYPNPARAGGKLTIIFDEAESIKEVQLYSSSGALVQVRQGVTFGTNKVEITLPSSLPAGTCFVRLLTSEGKTKTTKIVILN